MSARAAATVRVALVDDEPLARDRLRRQLADVPDVAVVAECADGPALLALLDTAEAVDLVFLDIQMPGMTGFDVLARVPPGRCPLIVFVTAHDSFALRAFEMHALDYLLKPVRPQRLAAAVERARAALGSELATRRILDKLSELRHELGKGSGYLERLAVGVGKRTYVLTIAETDWIEAADNYVRFHQQRRSYLHRIPMAELEKQLDPRRFVRVHRSAIVNVERIRDITHTPSGDGTVTLKDGAQVKLSRTYRPRLDALIR